MTLRVEVSPSSTAELVEATKRLESFALRHGLPEQRSRALRLVLEELLANVVVHGTGHGAGEPVVVLAGDSVDAIRLVITDTTDPFDPTAIPDRSRSGGDRSGGNGLRLVHRLVDEVTYVRCDGKNRTTAVFAKEPGPGEGGNNG